MSPPTSTTKAPFFKLPLMSALRNVISGNFAVSRTISFSSLLIVFFWSAVSTGSVSSSDAERIVIVNDAGFTDVRSNEASPSKSFAAIRWLCPLKYAKPARLASTINVLRPASKRNRATAGALSGDDTSVASATGFGVSNTKAKQPKTAMTTAIAIILISHPPIKKTLMRAHQGLGCNNSLISSIQAEYVGRLDYDVTIFRIDHKFPGRLPLICDRKFYLLVDMTL